MSIPLPLKTAVFLAIALVSAACAADSEPAADAEPSSYPTAAPTEASVPAARPTETPPETPTPQPAVILPDLGPAPDIANEVWLNTDRPLNLASLRGEVVLVEFWTFG